MYVNPSLTFYFKMFISPKAGMGALRTSPVVSWIQLRTLEAYIHSNDCTGILYSRWIISALLVVCDCWRRCIQQSYSNCIYFITDNFAVCWHVSWLTINSLIDLNICREPMYVRPSSMYVVLQRYFIPYACL